ncbi:hypothetical protein [Brevundimonas sp.]|uniref:hypothetical protein n=1 Tax=Brevundimonas sp. TaxID=1871086 RepID=UPI001D43B500|nr:hypothetical protein [Brevundimonas sp.]MBA3999220.1 hypothetical protein [Brevundimonas sp.]
MATEKRINWRFQIWLSVAVILTFALHEAGHWAVGELLGHEAYYGLNSAGVRGEVPDDHRLLIIVGGPAVTAMQAFVALALVLARESLSAYAVLYAAAFMRFMAAVITIMNPNDEARLSLALGWGTWTLPVVTVLALVGLVWVGARRLGVSWKTNLAAYGVATLATSAVVGADMLLKG